jgi:hypothetical protein
MVAHLGGRWGDEFNASLGYKVRSCLKNKAKQNQLLTMSTLWRIKVYHPF